MNLDEQLCLTIILESKSNLRVYGKFEDVKMTTSGEKSKISTFLLIFDLNISL